MENHKPKRLTRRGKLVAASAVTAGALLMSSVAWACTTDPTGAVPEWIHATIHCLTEEIPPEVGPGCPVQPSNAVAVDFVAHGSGLL